MIMIFTSWRNNLKNIGIEGYKYELKGPCLGGKSVKRVTLLKEKIVLMGDDKLNKVHNIKCLQKETAVILGYMKQTRRCINRSFNYTKDKIILPFLSIFSGQRAAFFIRHCWKTQGLRETKGETLEISVKSLLLPRLT